MFEKHANVGGACGEIYADTGKFGKYLWNPIVAGQNFEYKVGLHSPLNATEPSTS